MKTVAEINKQLAFIRKAGDKLDAFIQTTAVDVLTHYAEYKDVGLVNRLYLSLANGARKSAMTSWILAYAAVVANTDSKTAKERPFVCAKDAAGNWLKETKPEAAAQDKWHSHKPDPTPADVFDLQKAVRALLKKAGAAAKLEHGDAETMKALAKAVNIPESDVPTRPVVKAAEPAKDPLAV